MTDVSTTAEKHAATAKGAPKPAHIQAPPAPPAEAAAPPAPPAPPQVAAPPMQRHIAPLAQPRIKLTHASEDSTTGNRWTALVPAGTTWDDCKSDWFWANKANIMRPGDAILVIHDTWDFFGRLLVQQTRVVGPGIVPNRVTVIEESFREAKMPAPQVNLDGMYVKYMGVYPKWCIFERGKPEAIREGYDSEAEAERERRNLAATRTEPRRPDGWHG